MKNAEENVQMPIHALIVDDDPVFAEEFAELLTGAGFLTQIVGSLPELNTILTTERFDIVVLDQFLRGSDSLSHLLNLRRLYSGGLVVLTNNADDIDRVIGLELGADDFIHKLQKPREIVARLRAVARRSVPSGRPAHAIAPPPIKVGSPSGWAIDTQRHHIMAPGDCVLKLTMTEFELVRLLAERRGEVVDRDTLYAAVLGRPRNGADDRSLDNLVARVRRAFDALLGNAESFRSLRGRGYSYVGPTLEDLNTETTQ